MSAMRYSGIKHHYQLADIRIQEKRVPQYVTLILEDQSKKGIGGPLRNAGGMAKYRIKNSYQARLSADKVKPFLNSMPENIDARLSCPHKANAIIRQGTA